MFTHRKDLSRKYKNRVDYIDIDAFSKGKVKENGLKRARYINETDEKMANLTSAE